MGEQMEGSQYWSLKYDEVEFDNQTAEEFEELTRILAEVEFVHELEDELVWPATTDRRFF